MSNTDAPDNWFQKDTTKAKKDLEYFKISGLFYIRVHVCTHTHAEDSSSY